MNSLSLQSTFRLVLAMQAVCVGLSTAELLYCGELSSSRGLHSLRHLVTAKPPWLSADKIRGLIPVCLVVRLASAVWLVLAVTLNHTISFALFLICFSSIFLAWFKIIGGDGAEQMCFITLIAALLTVAGGQTAFQQSFFLIFVTGQTVLSYVTAGVAKLNSPLWRSGQALTRIIDTSSYGTPWAHRALLLTTFSGYLACWSVILWEISFPITLLGIGKLSLVMMGIGVLFHFGCALVMGLNDFVWAFVGTYPAVLYVSRQISITLW